jgi:3-carboxy-cis,cis-muconate cycloisomerase
VNLPQDTLFGELYGTAAMRAIFSAGERLRAMGAFEAALAKVQARLGIIPATAAAAIADAARRVDALDPAPIAEAAGTVGYPVVPFLRDLRLLAGPDAGGSVHWGATTQDVLDTATVLQLRDALTLLEDDLRATTAALATLAERHRADVMAGRTHLQHALPITFGAKVAVWLAPLIETQAAFPRVRTRVLQLQLGGAVGTLASLGTQARAVVEGVAGELNLGVPLAPWHADRSAFAECGGFVARACGSLAKIATDVMLLMQTEVAEVFEPYTPGRGGSSTMPQKRNPIACEYMLAGARATASLASQLLAALPGDHERSTGPLQAEELAIPPLMVRASAVFAQARVLAEGMRVDTARMRRNLDATHGLIVAEAVAMGLAPMLGNDGAHHLVEAACARALAENRDLVDVLAEDPAIAALADRATLERWCDPAGYTGESGAIVDRVLARYAAVAAPKS